LKYRIIGDNFQTVAVELAEGEAVFGRLGTLLFVKGAVKSDTNPEGPYWNTISQTISPGDDSPLVIYRCDKGGGLIGFHSPGTGRIHIVTADSTSRVIARRKCILAASEGIQPGRIHLEGEDTSDTPPHMFVSLAGTGFAFLHGPGSLVEFNLAPDERMVVDGQMILALEGDIIHDPKPVGIPDQVGPVPYIMLMHLTGPGRVILYTMSS